MGIHDRGLINKGFEALRSADAEEMSLDRWYGAEHYAQVVAAISDRVDPLSDTSSEGGDLDFVISRVGKSRSAIIHQTFVSVVKAEQEILNAYEETEHEVTSPKCIESGWADQLTDAEEVDEDILETISEAYGVNTPDDLPDFWHSAKLFLKKLERQSDSTESETYVIYFPLNLVAGPRLRKLPRGVALDGMYLERAGRSTVESMITAAKENPTPKLNGEAMSDAYFDTISLPNEREGSLWGFECEATSPAAASQTFRKNIAAVAGTLNYTENRDAGDLLDLSSIEEEPLNSDQLVGIPKFHLITRDGEYVGYSARDDRPADAPLRLGEEQRDSFQDILRVTRADSDVATAWQGAFEAYNRANAASTPEYEFWHLWQALEALTMTDNRSDSAEVLERCQGFMRRASNRDEEMYGQFTYLDSDVFEDRLDGLRDRRNNLVHGGERTEILPRDAGVLRYTFSVMVDAIQTLVRNDRNATEIIGIFAYGTSQDLSGSIREQESKAADAQETAAQMRAGDDWSAEN